MRPAAEPVTPSLSSSVGGGSNAPQHHRHALAIPVGLVVAAAVIVLDQATKQLAEELLVRGEFVPWLSDRIGWQLVYNPGAAFGIPAPIWLPLSVTVVVVIIVARALPRTTRLLPATSYGLLLAGAIGNVIDRLFRAGEGDGFGSGEVVDFIAWGAFPRFNVADSAITIGFVLLVVALWQEERSPEPADAGPGGHPTGHTDAHGRRDTETASDSDAGTGPEAATDPDAATDPEAATDLEAAVDPEAAVESDADADAGAPRGQPDPPLPQDDPRTDPPQP
jgi:signal peptidase II